MKVLKGSQKFFVWLGVCPIEDQSDHHKQLLYKSFGLLAMLSLGFIFVSCSVCAANYGMADLNNALNAAFPGIAAFRLFMSFVSMTALRQKVALVFEKLQTFHDQSK